MNKSQKICVVGLGYIGLPTALLFAKAGYKVLGVDVDCNKLKALADGKLYFKENGLEELFTEVTSTGSKISFSDVPIESDVFVIAVPTPTKKGMADLSYVFGALESIQPYLNSKTTIILESTVGPADCTDSIIPFLSEHGFNGTFALCTERAIPGNTIFEMVNNDRVIGLIQQRGKDVVADIYKSFVKGKIFFTDVNTAATAKLVENTYRAVNIALANELLKISNEIGIDVWEAISLANKHPRVNVHSPGPGVGGHCIPVDPYFLVKQENQESLILKALQINESMPQFVADKVKYFVTAQSLSNPTIGVFGYSYKKNVDDYRETPTKPLVKILSEELGFRVLLSDPYVKGKDIVDTYVALSEIDVAVFVVDHDEYQDIEFSEYPSIHAIIDTKNMFMGLKDDRLLGLGK